MLSVEIGGMQGIALLWIALRDWGLSLPNGSGAALAVMAA
jgi:hypothetical protein